MILNFHIEYRTQSGEHIAIRILRGTEELLLPCQTYDQVNWQAFLEVDANEQIEYQYALQTYRGTILEDCEQRQITIPKGIEQLDLQDFWRPKNAIHHAFFSAAFQNVIFKRPDRPASKKTVVKGKPHLLRFQLHAASIPSHLKVAVLGNHPSLGNWEVPKVMEEDQYPIWSLDIPWQEDEVSLEYKYVLFDSETHQIVEWETGDNRYIHAYFSQAVPHAVVRTDEHLRLSGGYWKGAGVAAPVFSLRTESGLGIGEFTDLKLFVDWAEQAGLSLVQVLPVNDTIAAKTWEDAYPYAAISVYALHPLYINLQTIAPLKDKKAQARLEAKAAELNALEKLDFLAVLEAKMEFFKLLFEQEGTAFLKSKEAKAFIKENADWLKPYACFSYLRDKHGTVEFRNWPEYSTFSDEVVKKLCNPRSKTYKEVAFFFFLQYHAHQQLLSATNYARAKGIVLKGDLPIGIYRHSCDAWVAPHLYNMDGQAGAPPDDYSETGQNWGFPTYNWEVMAQDNFEWWRQRMTKLATYFDALRIDHILGFFRIWQIPTDQVVGTMGLFNPRIPYRLDELEQMGLRGDLSRVTKPFIQDYMLPEIFGQEADSVRQQFLDPTGGGYQLKAFVDTQAKIEVLFQTSEYSDQQHLAEGLMKLVGEVLLIEEPGSNGQAYNPRITLQKTNSFKALPPGAQYVFDRLHNHYFYERHDQMWKEQALWKLPALLQASDMFICAEDLGMIPSTVPEVMEALNISSLEIQRMPKGSGPFGEPTEYPYLSVCSPSCHDMSTIRGWWEEDYDRAQQFYQLQLGGQTQTPRNCPPEIVEAINWQHMESPSMLAIFPLQDFMGMDTALRREEATSEQINYPTDKKISWVFRFHMTLEDLLEEKNLARKVRGMVVRTGR